MNAICNTPKLPFISIPSLGLKILIDSGASNSIINPKPANTFFKQYLFRQKFSVKSLDKTFTDDKNIAYPLLSEYGIDYEFKFNVVPWHERFDALIGSYDFQRLKAIIDYENLVLHIGNREIPFFIELNPANFEPFKQTVNKSIKIPVNVECGPVLIPERKSKNFYIPESIAYAQNGMCEIPFEEDRQIEVCFHEQINVEPLINVELQNPKTVSKEFDVTNIIRTNHLNPEEKSAILDVCKSFKSIFYNENCDLTFTNAVKHKIRTVDDEPVYCKSYRYPYHLKTEIQNQIQKLLDNKIIRPSISPYSSPVWIVPKKLDASGKKKWRLVIDYRKLNEKTVEDKYPLPRIDEILDNLGKCVYFTTLDLAQGFHQIEMAEESIEKTAFSVNNGHYEYVRMPFGLKNAPSTFQRVMDNILREYLYKFCFVYMDDVVIFSKSLHDHLIHIKQIFSKFREFNLKVQLDKSEFLCKEVAFLGHIITPEGIKPNPSKIKAVQEYPLPKTVKEIKSFLGLVGYYRRFIQNFAKILTPFTRCLKKGTKIDTKDPQYIEAFHKCKELLTNAPVLAYPDFEKTFHLTTDASNVAIGGVLSQNNHPIAFYSRTLNSAEKNYSTIEKELLSIVENTKHFRPYLYGRHFKIETDHKPLVWLMSLKDPNSRLVKWRLRLEEFDYEVIYKRGRDNYVADALSRIEINTKDVQLGDDEIDLISILPQCDTDDELSPEDADEILNQQNPLKGKHLPPSESGDTQHTADENPTFTLPISENPLNQFMYRLEIKTGDQYDVNYKRPFRKHHYAITLRKGQELQNIKNFLTEIVNPKTMYGIYFHDKNIESKFTLLCSAMFNNTVKLIKTNILCKDLELSDEQTNVIKDYHNNNHNGIVETYNHLKNKYYWPDMKTKINKIINECEVCLQSKYERRPYNVPFAGPLVAKRPFEVVHIDTFSFDNYKFLTIIDLFSKYVQAYYVEDLLGITILNKLRHYFAHHNYPDKIVCDEGKEFKNNTLQEYCKLFKINLHYTTNYNANSNSPIERAHSTLLEKIRTLKLTNKNESPQNLMISAVLIYNQSVHSSTGFTPFGLLYGPYDNLNTHEIDLDQTVYESYNEKRKAEVLAFYDQVYHKQLERGKKILEKRNEGKEKDIELNEPTLYFKKPKIRKADPCYEKVNVTSIQQNKIEGIKSKTKSPANIHTRKIKRLRKKISLQDDPPGNVAGPSSRKD